MAILSLSNLSGISTARFKNKIINGNFDMWQRGTSFAAVTNAAYNADRWFVGFLGGTLVTTVAKSTLIPTFAQSGLTSLNSIVLTSTTGEAAVAATEHCYVAQKIEGYNYQKLKGNTCTLSFWVRGTVTGTYSVSFIMGDSSFSYVSEYTISVANTWEKKTVTVTFDQAATTEELDNGFAIGVYFGLMCGSAYTTSSLDQWVAGSLITSTNQVNACETAGNAIRFSQVQLEVGSVATPFEHRSFGEELALCQRYFEKSYNVTTAPASVTGAGVHYFNINALNSANHTIYLPVTFKTKKRDVPTIILYTRNAATPAVVEMAAGNVAGATAENGEDGVLVYGTNGAAATGRILGFHFTATAEL